MPNVHPKQTHNQNTGTFTGTILWHSDKILLHQKVIGKSSPHFVLPMSPIRFKKNIQVHPMEEVASGFVFYAPSVEIPTSNTRKILKAKRRNLEVSSSHKNSKKNQNDPKSHLRLFCERMSHVDDVPTKAYIDVRGQENILVCLGNHILYSQTLGTSETKEELERYLHAYTKYYKKMGKELKTVPEEMWVNILEKLSVDDLKTFRLVSNVANRLVEKTSKWASDVCFVYDEKKKFYRECPSEQVCEDKTLGWPVVRLKNSTRFTLAFWKDLSIMKSITILELHDCNLSGSTLVTLLASMSKLEEFNYTLSHNRLDHIKIQKKLEEFYETRRSMKKISLRDERSEFARTIKKRHLRYDKTAAAETLKLADILPKIKRITLSTACLPLINIMLDILEEIVCSSLEELRIHCKMEMCFLPYATEIVLDKKNSTRCNRASKRTKNKAVEKKVQIRAKKIIENNQSTLKCLQLSFNADEVNEEFEEFKDLQGRPTLVLIAHLFKEPYYPNLSLKELILDFPNLLPAINHHNSEDLNDGCAYCEFRKLIEFCETQEELENLQLMRIHTSVYTKPLLRGLKKATKHAKVGIWGTIYPGHLDVERDDIGSMLAVMDVQLGGNDSIKSYSDFYSKDQKSMGNVKRLEIRSESKLLTDFQVPLMLQKFSSLTRLVVADVRMRSEGLKTAPKVDDKDFQTIIRSLPALVELVIRANLSDITDSGFTGLQCSGKEGSSALQSRVEELKRYCSKEIGTEEITKTGASINELPWLELLELHGLGPKVTDFTAYFLILSPHINLRELYLFTPDFGNDVVKSVKSAFVHRNGFILQVAEAPQ